MNTIVCPISTEKVNGNVLRILGFMVALLALAFVFTGSTTIISFLLADFAIRSFGNAAYSPLAKVSQLIAGSLKLEPKMIDKAPKLFAARVGFLFSLSSLVLAFISPPVSIAVAVVLMVCALLESLIGFCVGCVVYTYLVLPLSRRD